MTSDTHSDTPKQPSDHTPAPTKIKLSSKKSRKNTPFIWHDLDFNPVRGETALWVAVITQAMMDALSNAKNPEAQFHKHEAIRWLTENSKDFVEVCQNAGFNPDDIRRKAKKTIANPMLWRAKAGTGKRYLERKKYRQKLKLAQQQAKASAPAPSGADILIGPWA